MIEVKVQDNSAHIYLYGTIYPDGYFMLDETDAITSKRVRDKLSELKDDVKITVHINSRGGDVFTSLAIKNILESDKRVVSTCVDGQAASGGSIILQGSKHRVAYDNALILIHKGSTYAYGNAKELRELAEELDTVDKSIVSNYMGRFKGTEDELHKILDEGKYITAERAKELGLIDEVLDNEQEAVQSAANDLYEATMNRFMQDDEVDQALEYTKGDTKVSGDEGIKAKKNEQCSSADSNDEPINSFLNNLIKLM